MKKEIFIFGIGEGKKFVDRCLDRNNVNILGFVDNYKADTLIELNGIPIVRQDELDTEFDYIIVTLMQFSEIKKQLIAQGIEKHKIICFFDYKDADIEEYWSVLDSYKWRIELLWRYCREIAMPTIDNLGYELYGNSTLVQKDCPKIVDVERTVELLSCKKVCLARFGDNEFELMCGRLRTKYQDINLKLSERLKEVINSELDNLMIAIADNYGSLARFTDSAANDIRSYLSKEVRQNHMQLLKKDKQYYDAYLSRPYIMFRDRAGAAKRFQSIKEIWEDEDVLIVEGEHTRFGVGNDLLSNTSSVSRILVPNKNAFERYSEILENVRMYGKNKLILAVVGPTATVLAYDLAKENYWIIDIGQLDVEYEWYLRGVEKRCNIPYKCVSEVLQYDEIITDGEKEFIRQYQKQVVLRLL